MCTSVAGEPLPRRVSTDALLFVVTESVIPFGGDTVAVLVTSALDVAVAWMVTTQLAPDAPVKVPFNVLPLKVALAQVLLETVGLLNSVGNASVKGAPVT